MRDPKPRAARRDLSHPTLGARAIESYIARTLFIPTPGSTQRVRKVEISLPRLRWMEETATRAMETRNP